MVKEGILIIGHGSKMNYNKDILKSQAERLRKMGFENVYVGFNEISYPFIEDSLLEMSRAGVDVVYALPLFIASGVHLTKDVPEKLGIPENSHEGETVVDGRKMKIKYGTPIGDDPHIAEILAEKVRDLKGQ